MCIAGGGGPEVLAPSTAHAEGAARWTERVERDNNPTVCANASCAVFYLVVRNESGAPLHCHGALEGVVSTTALTGWSPYVMDKARGRVVQPGTEEVVLAATADVSTSLRAHSSSCAVVGPSASLSTPPGCEARFVDPQRLNTYYPPGSIRRTETGSVTLEFTLAGETGNASDVAVAKSTGYPAVDDAALRIIREEQLRTNCAGQRFRKTVNFRAEEPVRNVGDSGYIHSSVTSD